MGLGLQAPAAVPVEVRAPERRVFRLSRDIGTQAVRLVRPAPFEPGRPVKIKLRLPGGAAPLLLDARVAVVGDDPELEGDGTRGGCGLELLDPPFESERALADYVMKRLGLPFLP